jgi:hypothetical protein
LRRRLWLATPNAARRTYVALGRCLSVWPSLVSTVR